MAEHVTGLAPMQVPAWQVSICVQAFPSSQTAPSCLVGLEHVPEAGSQVPALWHWFSGEQMVGFAPVQRPF